VSASFSASFAAVDRSGRPEELLGFLDRVAGVEPVREAKRCATAAMGLRAGDRVLDVGCGTGFDLPAMAAEVGPRGRVTGIDVSARAVEEARRKVAGLPTVGAEVADVQDLPYADGSFDACRADRTLQHVPDVERGLSEIRRVLAPGGRLVVLELRTNLEWPAALGSELVARAVHQAFSTDDERRTWLGYMLPLLLARGGFADLSLDVTRRQTGDFDAADAALRLTEHVEQATRDGLLTAGDGAAWLERVRSAAAAGELTLTFEALTFAGRRPSGD
jgi:ubiquinone/menaquinone biosynthesis C-methylase UbiE